MTETYIITGTEGQCIAHAQRQGASHVQWYHANWQNTPTTLYRYIYSALQLCYLHFCYPTSKDKEAYGLTAWELAYYPPSEGVKQLIGNWRG